MSRQHVALVTGGGGGIGAAICARLAYDAVVVVAGRVLERCEATAERVRRSGGEALVVSLEVTDPASIERALSRARDAVGSIDWLVNNAGIAISAPIGEEDAGRDLYALHMDVNFHGARRVFEAVLPGMLRAGYGRVVQVASSAGLRGYPYVSAYTASKHALVGYTRAAAAELSSRGVALSAICPHYVDSPMVDESVARVVAKTGRSEEEARAFFAEQNPGGRLVTAAEVAVAAHGLLASDRTGVVVELVGGDVSTDVDAGKTVRTDFESKERPRSPRS